MSDTFTSEATVQRKLLNSIIPLITHQKIIGAVYKQTTRVVKLSILPFFQTRDITCLPLFQNSVTTTRRSSSKQTSPGISKSPISRPSFPKVFKKCCLDIGLSYSVVICIHNQNLVIVQIWHTTWVSL